MTFSLNFAFSNLHSTQNFSESPRSGSNNHREDLGSLQRLAAALSVLGGHTECLRVGGIVELPGGTRGTLVDFQKVSPSAFITFGESRGNPAAAPQKVAVSGLTPIDEINWISKSSLTQEGENDSGGWISLLLPMFSNLCLSNLSFIRESTKTAEDVRVRAALAGVADANVAFTTLKCLCIKAVACNVGNTSAASEVLRSTNIRGLISAAISLLFSTSSVTVLKS